MKKNYLAILVIVIISIILVSFRSQRIGSVKGSVTPADAATQVWLLSEKDTLRSGLANGTFQVNGVKPGTYALVVDAMPPYKRTTRTAIEVFEGSETNVGEIILEQVKTKPGNPDWKK